LRIAGYYSIKEAVSGPLRGGGFTPMPWQSPASHQAFDYPIAIRGYHMPLSMMICPRMRESLVGCEDFEIRALAQNPKQIQSTNDRNRWLKYLYGLALSFLVIAV
jgi:hypothetical protein